MAKKLAIGLVVLLTIFVASTVIVQNKINQVLTDAGITHWDFRLKAVGRDHLALKSLQLSLTLEDYLISVQLKDIVLDLDLDLDKYSYGISRVTVEYLQASVSDLSSGSSLKLNYDIQESLAPLHDLDLPNIEIGQTQLSYFQEDELMASATGALAITPQTIQLQQKITGSELPPSELVASLTNLSTLSLNLDHLENLFSIALETKLPGPKRARNQSEAISVDLQGYATLDKNNSLWELLMSTLNDPKSTGDTDSWIENTFNKYQSNISFKETLTAPIRYQGHRDELIHQLNLTGVLTLDLVGSLAAESINRTEGNSTEGNSTEGNRTEERTHNPAHLNFQGKLKVPHTYANGQLIAQPQTLETLVVKHQVPHSTITETPVLQDLVRYKSTQPILVQHRLTLPEDLSLVYNLNADLTFRSEQEILLITNTVDVPIFTQFSLSQAEGVLFPEQTFKSQLEIMLDISQTFTQWQGSLAVNTNEDLIELQLAMAHTEGDHARTNLHYFKHSDELKGDLATKITFTNTNATHLAKRLLARKTIKELENFTMELTGKISASEISGDAPVYSLTGPIKTTLTRLADEYLILHDLSFTAELEADDEVATFNRYQNQIRLVNVGLPITNFQSKGSFSYLLNDDKLRYSFDELRLELFSGYLGLASPTSGGLWLTPPATADDSPPANWQMVMSNIDLGAIAATLEATDIEMSGEIRGHFPMLLSSSGSVQVNNGSMESIPPGGFMKYTDQATLTSLYETDPQMKLVSETLENFQYTKLAGTLDIEEDGRMPMLIQLNGRNPDKNKGLAVNLNINLDYNLYDHLKSLRLTSEGFAQELEDNLSERQQ